MQKYKFTLRGFCIFNNNNGYLVMYKGCTLSVLTDDQRMSFNYHCSGEQDVSFIDHCSVEQRIRHY